jgi:hypothetical protein
LPTGNPDSWDEPQDAPKKYGKPSKVPSFNPDVPSLPTLVNRTIETRTRDEIYRDWIIRQEALIKPEIERKIAARELPPREQFNPASWDILGTFGYAEGAFWNWYYFKEDFGKSFMGKVRSTEVFDRTQYLYFEKLESGEIPVIPHREGDVRTAQEMGKILREEYESPESVKERAGFWRNLGIDIYTGIFTYVNPFSIIGKGGTLSKELLFSGRSGKELETTLKVFRQQGITKIRAISQKYIDPNTEKIGMTISKLKIETASMRRATQRRKELREIEMESRINLFHERELVKSDLEAFRTTIRADIGDNAEQALTTYINYPETRAGLIALNPKIEYYAQQYQKYNAAIAREELAWTAIKNVMDNSKYLHKKLTPEAEQILNKNKNLPSLYDVTNDAGIARTGKDILEQNKAFRAKFGVDLFDMNAVNAQIARATMNRESAAAVNYLRLVDELYGIPIKDIPKSGYSADIPYFADKGRAIPDDVRKALQSNRELLPFLQGDRNAGRQVIRGIIRAKDMTLAGNAWLTHASEKLKTYFFPPYWFWNYAGGKWLQWMGGKLNPVDTVNFVKYASTEKRIAQSGERIIAITPKGRTYTILQINEEIEKTGWKRVNIQGVVPGDKYTSAIAQIGQKGEYEIRWTMLVNSLKTMEMDDAIVHVNKYQGDYTIALGKTERFAADNIMFYRWQRFIYPLLAQMMIDNPQKMTTTARFVSETWNSEQAQMIRQYISPQEKSSAAIYVGGENYSYGTLNLPPTTLTQSLYAMNETIRRGEPGPFVSQLSPLTQMAYQEYAGKEPFWGTNITDPFGAKFNIFFGRYATTMDYARDDRLSAMTRTVGLVTGFKQKSGTALLAYNDFVEKTNERIVNNAIRRLGGAYHGCGF